jgi:hypothetical protein
MYIPLRRIRPCTEGRSVGVSLDEEFANMIKFLKSFEAFS